MILNNQQQTNLGMSCSNQPFTKTAYNEENKIEGLYEARNQTKLTLRKQKLKSTLDNERRIQMMINNAPKQFNGLVRYNLTTLQNFHELNIEFINNSSYKEKLTCVNYMLERNNYDSKVFAICVFFDMVDNITDEINESEMSLFVVQPMITNLLAALKLVHENQSLAVSLLK